jgi:D-beta-D-heptose 7-phosphate kinase/D-beta-D-heptose 1-phosphate adenosyltransferase
MGDLTLLEKAHGYCERLVIVVRSDSALQRAGLKASVQDQRSRAYVLASMVFSDAVVVCDEQTVDKLLSTLRPDVVLIVPNTPLDVALPEDWNGEVVDLSA